MATQRYELVDGGATKYWELEGAGTAYTARWGKVGASGRNQRAYTFESEADAQKAIRKLVSEKLRQGYSKIGGTGKAAAPAKPPQPAKPRRATKPANNGPVGNPELEQMLADRPDDATTWLVYADWLLEHGEPWGETIAAACNRKPHRVSHIGAELLDGLGGSKITWSLASIDTVELCPEIDAEAEGYDPERTGRQMHAALARILAHPAGRLVRKLVLGLPPTTVMRWDFDRIFAAIARAGPLPLLHTIDCSRPADHMDQDSWRRVGDMKRIWKAAPRLRHLYLLGAAGEGASGTPIDFGTIVAPHLETIVFKSGGLDAKAPTAIGKAKLPKLRHLELWFGRDRYGNNCTLASIAGILAGDGLPALRYLGLRNTERWEAELVDAVANAPILRQLDVLDLSKGTLYEEAAAAVLRHAERFAHLERLDLSENYVTWEHAAAIEKLLPNAVVANQKRVLDPVDEPDARYPTMSE